ncbi:MAG: hypothetical protein H6704_29990 [Myxococcales bacterium]|nr:hypothetical protein [Myxococcales bacterium]
MRAWVIGLVGVVLALGCAAEPDGASGARLDGGGAALDGGVVPVDGGAAGDAETGGWLDPRVVEPARIERPYSAVGLAPMIYDGRPLAPLVARVGARATFAFGHRLTVYDLDSGARVAGFDLTGPILGLWVVGDAVVGLATPGAPLAVPEGGSFAARAVVFRAGEEGLQTVEVDGVVRDAALVDGHLLLGVVEAPDGRIPFDEVDSPAALLAVNVGGAPALVERLPLGLGPVPYEVGRLSVVLQEGAPPAVVVWDAETGFGALASPLDSPHGVPSAFPGGVVVRRDEGLQVAWWGEDGWSAPMQLPSEGRVERAGDVVFEAPSVDRPGRVGTIATPGDAGWLGPLEWPAGVPAELDAVRSAPTAHGLLVLWAGHDHSVLALYGPAPGPPVAVSPPLPARAWVWAQSWEASTLLAEDAGALLVSGHPEPTRLLLRDGDTWQVVDDAVDAPSELYAVEGLALLREGDHLTAWRDGMATDLGFVGPTIDRLAFAEGVAVRWAHERLTTRLRADALRAGAALDIEALRVSARTRDLVGAVGGGVVTQGESGFEFVPVDGEGRLGAPRPLALPYDALRQNWGLARVDGLNLVRWDDALLAGAHVVRADGVVDLDVPDGGFGWFSDGEAWWWAAPDDAGRVTIQRLVDPAAPRLEPPIALPGRPLGTDGPHWVTVTYTGRVEGDPARCPAPPLQVEGGCLRQRTRLALWTRDGGAWVERAAVDLGDRPVVRAAVGGGAVHVQLRGDGRLQSFQGVAAGRLDRAWTARVLDPIAEYPTDTCCFEAPGWLHALPDGGVALVSHAGYRAARWDAAGNLTLAPRATTGTWGTAAFWTLARVEGEPVIIGAPGPIIDAWIPPDAHFAARPVGP